MSAPKLPLDKRIEQINALRAQGLKRHEIALELGLERDTITNIEWKARHRRPPKARPARPLLTAREKEVLAMRADGLSTKQIGRRLHMLPNTVASHCRNARVSLGAKDITHAVVVAMRKGLLSLHSEAEGQPS